MTTRFRISTRRSGRLRTITVVVYEDLARLRRDAANWGKKYGSDRDGLFAHAEGVAHRWKRDNATAGMIRLWRGRLGVGLLAHELSHIAIWIYFIDCNEDLTQIEHEETFCHILGDLYTNLVAALYKRKFYDQEDDQHGYGQGKTEQGYGSRS